MSNWERHSSAAVAQQVKPLYHWKGGSWAISIWSVWVYRSCSIWSLWKDGWKSQQSSILAHRLSKWSFHANLWLGRLKDIRVFYSCWWNQEVLEFSSKFQEVLYSNIIFLFLPRSLSFFRTFHWTARHLSWPHVREMEWSGRPSVSSHCRGT